MHITIIGTGNVAWVLGKLLLQNKIAVQQVAARNMEQAAVLANALHAKPCLLADMTDESDVYLIAVSDTAVNEVASKLFVRDKIVAHTCGSVSIDILQPSSCNYGVLYPLQSIRKETSYLPDIPFLIDGNNAVTKNKLHQLAAQLSKNICYADDDERLLYHISAITTSNFSNFLNVLVKDFCNKHQLKFNNLVPLIQETANRLEHFDPSDVQTGPAARNDITTIKKHFSLLQTEQPLHDIYKLMTNAILQYYHQTSIKNG